MGEPGMRSWAVLAGVLFLAGCQTTGNKQQNFAHRQIPVGAVAVLDKPITIPAEDAAVRIQDGRVVPTVDEMRPYCKFEVRTRLEKAQEVSPDRFVITRVNWGTSRIQAGLPVMVAQMGFGDSGMPIHLYYQTELYLRSDRQPDVSRITCEVDRVEAGGLSFHSYLSLTDVRGALDGLFRLELDGAVVPRPPLDLTPLPSRSGVGNGPSAVAFRECHRNTGLTLEGRISDTQHWDEAPCGRCEG